MSGSSGDGGGSGIPQASEEVVDCSNLKIRTQLASPNPSVLASLKNNDALTVQLVGAQGPLQAITSTGQVAGGIITSKQIDLIKCINSGFLYQAIVINITGGKCEIVIQAV